MGLSLGRGLAAAATAGVAAALVAALLVIDGPATERAQRIDARRVEDLRDLAHALDCVWTLDPVAGLPGSLEDLESRIDAAMAAGRLPWSCRPGALADPETGVPYVYRRLDARRHELCASFGRPSPEADSSRLPEDPWVHGAGEVCFRRPVRTVALPNTR